MNRTLPLVAVSLLAACGLSCNKAETPPKEAPPRVEALRDEIPPDKLNDVLAAHYQGLGAMERYEYADAIQAFKKVHAAAPGWIAGSINLAIALLNEGGEAAEESGDAEKARNEGLPRSNMDQAVRLLDEVLGRQPKNPSALFCKGIIREFQGNLQEAHGLFGEVLAIDPTDAHAWLERGATLTDPADPEHPAGPDQASALIGFYSKALEHNPYLVPALFKLQTAYGWAGETDQRARLLALWQKLNPKLNAAASGEPAAQVYGEMGKYARIINPMQPPAGKGSEAPPPRFAPPESIAVALPTDHRWATDADFAGPHVNLARARSRFGGGMVALDANGDGRLDLYLPAAIVGPQGLRDALLIRRAEGDGYDEASAAWGLPADRAGLGVAVADYDADRRPDLFVFGLGDQRLFRNTGAKFEDVTDVAEIDRHAAITVGARWLDLDQDGDLDLYVVNHAAADQADRAFREATPGIANAAYRNDGQPAPVAGRPQDNFAPVAVATSDLPAKEGLSTAFSTAWPGLAALVGEPAANTAVAALDIDEDRDLDLVIAADGAPIRVAINDRGGAYHAGTIPGVAASSRVDGLLTVDLDKDGRIDLVATSAEGRVVAWRNVPPAPPGQPAASWTAWPVPARSWGVGMVADLDLDTNPDLVAAPAASQPPGVEWLQWGTGTPRADKLALGPDPAGPAPLDGLALGQVAGDLLPDLILWSRGGPPRVAKNLGNGMNWVALELSGRWKTSFDQMRTNSQGIGTRLALEGQGILAPFDYITPASGPSQSPGLIVLGLGKNLSAPLLRLRWPDGVMQSELNVTANKLVSVVELSRKTGSCPVLFTWNGTRHECLGDFLGGGGMGYLVKPGVYGEPDRDEAVAISSDQLKLDGGRYHIAVVEPMDEVAYLDHLKLDVVDAPPGLGVILDERFAPEPPRPSGQARAVARRVEPVRVTDHKGRDVTDRIRAWDRKTVDGFARRLGWVGYAEEHAVTIDFGDRLRDLDAQTPVALCLAGWVEYPYSQTNYAAASSGVDILPPVLERLQPDGSWKVVEASMGYPAGLPRQMSVDLTGKLAGESCVLRVRTSMECYWDQIDLAVLAPDASRLVTTTLAVSSATLGDKGYLREVSPDGGMPLIYDYAHPDPAPLARMAGSLTRHGDVAQLLQADDDHLCTVGPGDEVRVEFDAASVPPLPDGWTRRFVLRAFGYCKDADPYTAGSDTVEPLPWKGMPPYPFQTGARRPADPAYDAYLKTMQTRPAGSR